MATNPSYTDPNWKIVSTGDRNGDGSGDILWQNVNDQSLVLWTQDGTTTTSTSTLPSESGYQVVATGDLDGDGKADYLMEPSSGGARKMLLSSTGTIQQYSAGTANWQVRDTTDVSNDNKDDVIWYDTDTQKVWVGVMDGTSQTDFATFASGYTASDSLHAAYDGSAKDSFSALWFDDSTLQYDLVTYSGGAKTVKGTFVTFYSSVHENSGDYDGDGNTDHLFLVTNADSSNFGSAEVYFTDSSNNLWQSFEFFSETSRFGTDVDFQGGGDLDGDGTYELLKVDTSTGEKTTFNVKGGSGSSDVISGGSQSDAIDGRAGNDTIFGNGGDDLLLSGDGNDMIQGGSGDDFIQAKSGRNRSFGGDGDDEIESTGYHGYSNGGAGNDKIYDWNGIADGGDGDDYMVGSGSQLRGGGGNDVMVSGGVSVLQGDGGDDQLFGASYGSSVDVLFGGTGNDYLDAGGGADTLWGGDGDDILVGSTTSAGTDVDHFYGGYGKDYFVLGETGSSYYVGSGRAEIHDYTGNNNSTNGDHLVLAGSGADYTSASGIGWVDIAKGGDLIVRVHTTDSLTDVLDSIIFIG